MSFLQRIPQTTLLFYCFSPFLCHHLSCCSVSGALQITPVESSDFFPWFCWSVFNFLLLSGQSHFLISLPFCVSPNCLYYNNRNLCKKQIGFCDSSLCLQKVKVFLPFSSCLLYKFSLLSIIWKTVCSLTASPPPPILPYLLWFSLLPPN